MEQSMQETEQNPHLAEEHKQETPRSMREATAMRADVDRTPHHADADLHD